MNAKLISLCSTVLVASGLNALAQPLPARLRIDRTPAGSIRLELLGESGRNYSIEATDALGTGSWAPLFNFTLPGETQTLLDPASLGLARRFYRAVTFDGPAPVESASNFRLIDHTGKSRELNYHWADTNVSAFVLFFTVNGCAAVRDQVPALDALRRRFEPQRVRFWMINSDPADSRSNIVADVAALGLSLPVLHDRAQLVARAYHVATATEVFVVGRGEFPNQWHFVYRGALEDRSAANAPTQPYVADALDALLTDGSAAFKRTPSSGCPEPLRPVSSVTYANDIAPILQAKCVRCHSPGNIAPWSMKNYNVVLAYAGAIREEVLAGRMPPWHADPEYGVFTNDFSLKPAEAATLLQWIDDGAPRGEGPDPLADTPPPLEYPFAWPRELGEPDAILIYPLQTIAATGIEPYRDLAMTSPFPSNVWLRAAVVLPSNPRAAHHEEAYLGDFGNPLSYYNPGQAAWNYPPGTRRLLPQGAVVRLNLHYVTSGMPQTDHPRVGFWLARDVRPLVIQVASIGWAQEGAGVYPPIQPYVQDDVRTATYTFSSDVYAFLFMVHMHLRGTAMKHEALYPDGSRETLLSVPQFHAHWQTMYRLDPPKRLPSGTTIRITGAFDNSPMKEHNPDPSQLVNWGEQLRDEMFLGGVHFAETLTIRTQPRSQAVPRGGTVTFTVSATTPYPPLRYQWQFNGAPIAGATNASLVLSNVQPASAGTYAVTGQDAAETLLSQPATLAVGDRPVITMHPQSQTAVVGSDVSFSVMATGTLPLSYRWRKGGTTVTNMTLDATTAVLTLTNVQTNQAGNYSVAVTNLFGVAPLSSNAVLTVLSP